MFFFLDTLTFSVVFLSYGCLMSEKNLSRITQKPRNGSLLTLPGGCVSARILGDITRHGFLFLFHCRHLQQPLHTDLVSSFNYIVDSLTPSHITHCPLSDRRHLFQPDVLRGGLLREYRSLTGPTQRQDLHSGRRSR